jgi:hypothetical protein
MKASSNKELVQFFFDNLWANPEAARQVCTEDVTWVTTRSRHEATGKTHARRGAQDKS